MRKSHPVAQVLRLIDTLADNEKQIVRDYLRPERKKSGKSSPVRPVGERSSSKKSVQSAPTASTVTDKADVVAAQAASSGGD